MPYSEITSSDQATFERDGIVIKRGYLHPEEIALAV